MEGSDDIAFFSDVAVIVASAEFIHFLCDLAVEFSPVYREVFDDCVPHS
jgi:hypothetical protein